MRFSLTLLVCIAGIASHALDRSGPYLLGAAQGVSTIQEPEPSPVPPTREVVRGPDHWVEFTALFAQYGPDDEAPTAVGRFFRGPDGSERLDLGPTLTGPRSIVIKNFTTGFLYRWGNGPSSRPGSGLRSRFSTEFDAAAILGLTAQDQTPTAPRAHTVAGWHVNPMSIPDSRLAPLRGAMKKMFTPTASPVTYEGFEVYSHEDRGGTWSVWVPALNLLVADMHLRDGTRLVYSQIRVGSNSEFLRSGLPSDEAFKYRGPLFEPPAGERLTWHDELEGDARAPLPPPPNPPGK
jgi:hypothetical protein